MAEHTCLANTLPSECIAPFAWGIPFCTFTCLSVASLPSLPERHLRIIACCLLSRWANFLFYISTSSKYGAAVFYIMDEDSSGIGVGVFFSKSKAVTADHNLTASHVVGSQVVVQIPGRGSMSTQLRQDVSKLFVLSVVKKQQPKEC